MLPYQNSASAALVRAQDLTQRLSLKEKIAQISGLRAGKALLENEHGEFNPEHAGSLLGNGIGHFARPSERADHFLPGRTPRAMARYCNSVQDWLVKNTRWGIPALFHEEALHGHAARHGTHFPQAIGLASTFNPPLLEKAMAAAACEIRARGAHQAFAPLLDIARDPRWGRIEETFGEDPYLTSALGLAVIKGLQGEGNFPDQNKVIAALKHLAGHGEPVGGTNTAPCQVGERHLRELFLRPFEACLAQNSIHAVMASYNEIDGVPSHVNAHLLTSILREEWGFSGTVISDYYALKELMAYHKLSDNPETIAALALRAGVSVDLPDGEIFQYLAKLAETSRQVMHQIDQAVEAVLYQKFALGLFEQPYVDEGRAQAVTNHPDHQALAYQSALESAVLLTNLGNTLPINTASVRSIALIGPHTQDCLLGGYSDIPQSVTTLHDGLKRRLTEKDIQLISHPGCYLTQENWEPQMASDAPMCFSKVRWLTDEVQWPNEAENIELVKKAVDIIKQVDLAILVLGENESLCREGWSSDHLGDTSELTLRGQQRELLARAVATGTPIVVILQNGRPITLSPEFDGVKAIMEIWYLGQEGGRALADLLLGNVSPSGKLPLSIPRSSGHLPCYYNQLPSAKRGFQQEDIGPQFAFGHGLSYSEFLYSDLTIEQTPDDEQTDCTLSFTLRNTGRVTATETTQLYISHRFAGTVTRPTLELKGFQRVELQPGEMARIEYCLPVSVLGYYNHKTQFCTYLGELDVIVAAASDDPRLKETLTFHRDFPLKDGGKAFTSSCRIVAIDEPCHK